MTISQSFFHLARTNNGYFVSHKQAAFLLSQCQENQVFTCSGEVYGNPYRFFFVCDQYGIMHIEKHTDKKVDVWWKRNENHQEFLREKAELDARTVKKRAQAAYINKARAMVNRFKRESSARLLARITGEAHKDEARVKKAGEWYNKWTQKMDAIEREIDKMEFGDE